MNTGAQNAFAMIFIAVLTASIVWASRRGRWSRWVKWAIVTVGFLAFFVALGHADMAGYRLRNY